MLRSRQEGCRSWKSPQERLKNEQVAPRALRALLQRSREGTRERLPLPRGAGAAAESRGEERSCRGPAVRGTLPPAGSAVSGNCPI